MRKGIELIKIKALKRRSQRTYNSQSGYYTNRYCEPQEFDFWEKGPFDYALLIDGVYYYCEPVNVLLKCKEVVFFAPVSDSDYVEGETKSGLRFKAKTMQLDSRPFYELC
jgi:hypothetical protein